MRELIFNDGGGGDENYLCDTPISVRCVFTSRRESRIAEFIPVSYDPRRGFPNIQRLVSVRYTDDIVE